MNDALMLGVVALISVLVGWLIGWGLERMRLRRARMSATDEATRILTGAEADADRIRKAADLEGREAAFRARAEWEREETKRREDVERGEQRLDERRTALDRKYEVLDAREAQLDAREAELTARSSGLQAATLEHERLRD